MNKYMTNLANKTHSEQTITIYQPASCTPMTVIITIDNVQRNEEHLELMNRNYNHLMHRIKLQDCSRYLRRIENLEMAINDYYQFNDGALLEPLAL